MSSIFGSQPAASQIDTDRNQQDAGDGKRHDRILLEEQDTTASNMSNSGAGEISTTQRMISATWGSVLTTLLGKLDD
jgi:hypothetical protein